MLFDILFVTQVNSQLNNDSPVIDKTLWFIRSPSVTFNMQLAEVLRLFNSPLSQEQCWAICYGVCTTLISKRREDSIRRERIKYIVNLDSLILTQRGDIEILHSEPSYQDWQRDTELIYAVGNLICQCLDYGLSEIEICEVRFQDDLAELIGGEKILLLLNYHYCVSVVDRNNVEPISCRGSLLSRKFAAIDHMANLGNTKRCTGV